MDILRCALEDPDHSSKANRNNPKPSKDWKWPSPEELQTYFDGINESAINAENFCASSTLGFYMVRH